MKIKDIIYETLLKDDQWFPYNHNPSSASFKYPDGKVIGKDLLSLYYKWNKVPPSDPIKGSSLFLFKLGDGVHSEVSKILARASIKAQSETKFEAVKLDGLDKKIGFRPDILCEIGGNLEVLELKSSKDAAMFEWKNISIQTLGPKEDHLLQVICYLNLIPGLKRGRIVYISRDSGEMLEYELERHNPDTYYLDGELIALNFAGIVARWKELETALTNKVEPLPEFKIWKNDSGSIFNKTIKGITYKSAWQATYSNYKTKIYLDPKNYRIATYNYILETQGEEAIKKLYGSTI